MLMQVFQSISQSGVRLKFILHALVSFQWFSVCLHSRGREEEEAGTTVSLFSLLVAKSPLPLSLSQCVNITTE